MGKAQPIKEQAFAVVRTSCFSCAGRQRYKWLADLDNQVQQAVELIKGNRPLPVVIKVKSERSTEIVFECGQKSWVEAYEVPFSRRECLVKQQTGIATRRCSCSWLATFRSILVFACCQLGISRRVNLSPEARRYVQDGNSLYEHMQAGLAPKSVNGNLLLL